MRFILASAALSAALIGAAVFATSGHAAGLTSLHNQTRIGNQICMMDHLHYGQSGAWATKAEATAVAARSWSSFTALEYGDAWADYGRSRAQKMDCGQVYSERGSVLWQCKTQAMPCRAAEPADTIVASPGVTRLRRQVLSRMAPIAHRHQAIATEPHSDRRTLIWPGDRR